MKKCPYCAEEIQDDAIVCRFCKKNLKAWSVYDPIKKVVRDTKAEIDKISRNIKCKINKIEIEKRPKHILLNLKNLCKEVIKIPKYIALTWKPPIQKMIRRLKMLIIFIIIIGYGLIFFYDIKFGDGGYDISFSYRKNNNYGIGINYKDNFEVWRFWENQHKGHFKSCIWLGEKPVNNIDNFRGLDLSDEGMIKLERHHP